MHYLEDTITLTCMIIQNPLLHVQVEDSLTSNAEGQCPGKTIAYGVQLNSKNVTKTSPSI